MSKKIYAGDNYLDSSVIMFDEFQLNELGLIIDYKANSNGTYIKFNNGFLIQYGSVNITVNNPRQQGGLSYYSGAEIINLPVNFANSDYLVFTNIILANMNFFAQSYAAVVSNSQVQVSFATTGSNETRRIQWVAIGRWK